MHEQFSGDCNNVRCLIQFQTMILSLGEPSIWFPGQSFQHLTFPSFPHLKYRSTTNCLLRVPLEQPDDPRRLGGSSIAFDALGACWLGLAQSSTSQSSQRFRCARRRKPLSHPHLNHQKLFTQWRYLREQENYVKGPNRSHDWNIEIQVGSVSNSLSI